MGGLMLSLEYRLSSSDTKDLLVAEQAQELSFYNLTRNDWIQNSTQFQLVLAEYNATLSNLTYDINRDYSTINLNYFFHERFTNHDLFHGIGGTLDYTATVCIVSTMLLRKIFKLTIEARPLIGRHFLRAPPS